MSTAPLPQSSPSVLAAVRWTELFPWLLLVRAARVALMARVIALAVAGVLATQMGWAGINSLLLDLPAENELVRLTHRPPPRLWGSAVITTGRVLVLPDSSRLATGAERSVLAGGDYADLQRVVAERLNWGRLFEAVDAHRFAGPALRGWAWAMQPFARLIDASGWRQWVGLILAGIWSLAVWALFGGAIARIAAVYLTREEVIGPVAALQVAAARWPAMAGAPAFCLLLIAILALVLAVIGLMVKLGLFALVIGVFWCFAILIGVAIAIVAIGLFVGWPLMWATAAVERTDAFDGVSRGYAYTYQRPLHLAFFLLVATVLGLLSQAAVSVFTDAALKATHWGVRAGAGDERMRELFPPPAIADDRDDPGMLTWAGGKAMRFWTLAALWVAASFPMAYLWPAATGIYLLQRRAIDSTDLNEGCDDVDLPDKGLPPLGADPATGVPQVQPVAPPGPAVP